MKIEKNAPVTLTDNGSVSIGASNQPFKIEPVTPAEVLDAKKVTIGVSNQPFKVEPTAFLAVPTPTMLIAFTNR